MFFQTSLAHLWHCLPPTVTTGRPPSERPPRLSEKLLAHGPLQGGDSDADSTENSEPLVGTGRGRAADAKGLDHRAAGGLLATPQPSLGVGGSPEGWSKCGKNGEKSGRNVVEMGRSPFQRQISKRPKLITHIARNEVFIRRAVIRNTIIMRNTVIMHYRL